MGALFWKINEQTWENWWKFLRKLWGEVVKTGSGAIYDQLLGVIIIAIGANVIALRAIVIAMWAIMFSH